MNSQPAASPGRCTQCMRDFIYILLFGLVSCNAPKEPKSNSKSVDLSKISLISFELESSLRIPNHKVSIEITKQYNGIFIHAISTPSIGNDKWDKTRRDTTFAIDSVSFNNILTSVRKISSNDLESVLLTGDDGTSCEIKYGNYQNSISYLVWSPSSVPSFFEACNEILKVAKFDPKEIL